MKAFSTRHLPVLTADLFGPRPKYNPDWKDEALCKNHPELFLKTFEDDTIGRKRNEVVTQKICLACPVRLNCLWHALDVPERYYMWGGASEDQLYHLRQLLRLGY